MRTAADSLFHTATPLSRTITAEANPNAKATFSPTATVQPSPWRSPVPYLFGGLAALLGLIALALLLLACSHWRHYGEENGVQRDLESRAGEKGESSTGAKAPPAFEEKFLVIMAGEARPTFLATPAMSGKGSALNDEKVETKGKEENIPRKDEATQGNGEGAAESQLSQEHSH